jgi:hypothetical protein
MITMMMTNHHPLQKALPWLPHLGEEDGPLLGVELERVVHEPDRGVLQVAVQRLRPVPFNTGDRSTAASTTIPPEGDSR